MAAGMKAVPNMPITTLPAGIKDAISLELIMSTGFCILHGIPPAEKRGRALLRQLPHAQRRCNRLVEVLHA